LVNNYGPLLTMWFDVPREVHQAQGLPVTLALRQLQPNIVINNRGYMEPSGDYDTPEQKIGGFNRNRPWETCMTICQQWAWKPNDAMKSLEQCVQTLLYTIGGDGNLLFNVGPMPDGRIEPRQVDRLKEMGDWITPRAEAIYGTRGGPIKPGPWGASTCKDDHVYLFVMNWPTDGPLTLPTLGAKITEAKLLAGGAVKFTADDQKRTFDVPADQRDAIATVIRLTVEGKALDIVPVSPGGIASGSVARDKAVQASNVFANNIIAYGPMRALDDDPSTRWATNAGVHSATLDVDLGKPTTIDRIRIIEPTEYHRVRQFELLYRNDADWKVFHTGTTIGPNFDIKFKPIIAQRVMLRIGKADDGPTLSEFQVFAPSTQQH
jgi:alpha-L-fucosidase